MSEKRIFELGYVETRPIQEYYRSITIDVSDYPELEGKTDAEIIKYIKDNSEEMAPINDFYDSLEEELRDQDIIRTKDGTMDSYIWVDVYVEKEEKSDEDDDEDYDDEEYDDDDE